MTSRLLVKPDLSANGPQVHLVTPQSAGWRYVGFEVFDLAPGQTLARRLPDREQCLVLLSGRANVRVASEDFGTLGNRTSPLAGKPFAVYVPPRTEMQLTAEGHCELAVGSAPAEGRFRARLIRPDEVREEVRGTGTNTRYVYDILPEGTEAESLLVVEVRTPGGHWSSYPPHKHDVHDPPREVDLDEIYYYRMNQPEAFAFQHLYSGQNSAERTVKAKDGDAVLVRSGFHPVVAGPGYDVYYLNFLAGSSRTMAVTEDPQHVWIRSTWKETDPRLPMVRG